MISVSVSLVLVLSVRGDSGGEGCALGLPGKAFLGGVETGKRSLNLKGLAQLVFASRRRPRETCGEKRLNKRWRRVRRLKRRSLQSGLLIELCVQLKIDFLEVAAHVWHLCRRSE